MSAAIFRVNDKDKYNWDEIQELLGFVDTRNVLALEVGQHYTDFDGDEWERIA